MDAATSIYNSMNTEADIEALASDPETLHLDFKERAAPAKPLGKDDETLKFLAKALSGFANSAGGVLVIGVNDKTRKLVPMPSLAAAEAQMHQQFSRLVTPPVPGAIAKAIKRADDETAGYLVVLVPQSEEGPHQSQKSPKQYYMRVGESFSPMEHHQLELHFGRPPRPALSLTAKFWYQNRVKLCLMGNVFLTNRGRGMAREPMIQILRVKGEPPLPEPTLAPVNQWKGRRADAESPVEFWSSLNVYPDLSLLSFQIEQVTLAHDRLPAVPILLEARLFADNVRPTRRRLRVAREQYEKIVGGPGIAPEELIVEDEPLLL